MHVAPLVGTSMSWLSGPAPRSKVSSQNQGLSVAGHPPGRTSGGSRRKAEKGLGCGDQQLSFGLSKQQTTARSRAKWSTALKSTAFIMRLNLSICLLHDARSTILLDLMLKLEAMLVYR